MVDTMDLKLLFRLGRTWDSMNAEMSDSFDGGSNSSADCIIDSSFRIVLLHNDHSSTNLLDIVLESLHIQRLERKDIQHSYINVYMNG